MPLTDSELRPAREVLIIPAIFRLAVLATDERIAAIEPGPGAVWDARRSRELDLVTVLREQLFAELAILDGGRVA